MTSVGTAPAVATVLAGGRASRMGGTKASAPLAGRPMISHVLAAVEAANLKAVVIAKRSTPLPALPVQVQIEPDEPIHPLVGVLTGLQLADAVVAIPCDMPFLTAELLAWLAAAPDESLVGHNGGQIQPFPALYHRSAAHVLERAVAGQSSVRAALAELGAQTFDLSAFGDPQVLTRTVNTPGDLAAAELTLARRAPDDS